MWQEINYFLWGGSAGIEKKGGYYEAHCFGFASLAWSFSQYAISAGTLVAIDGRDGGELMVLGEEVPHENGG